MKRTTEPNDRAGPHAPSRRCGFESRRTFLLVAAAALLQEGCGQGSSSADEAVAVPVKPVRPVVPEAATPVPGAARPDTERTPAVPAPNEAPNEALKPEPEPEPEIEGPRPELAKSTVAYTPPALSPLRAVPGIEGFGTGSTTGGRGGRVLVVTNRAPTGPGTLAEALTTPGPRIVLFDVSGELVCPEPLAIAFGDVSVYGQSAPGDGVHLRARPDSISPGANVHASNVLFQHCRFRPGASNRVNANRDAVAIGNSGTGAVGNVVFDHCSFSWGTDELIDVWYGSHDVTFHRCLIYEGLYHSTSTGTGTQSYPALIGGGSHRISMVQCVMAHGDYRMPAIFSARDVDIFNCIVACYTSVPTVLQCQYDDRDVTGNIEDCLYIDTFGRAYAEIIAYRNVASTGRIRMHIENNGRTVGPHGATIGPARLHTGQNPAPADHPPFNAARVAAPRPPAIPLHRLERTLLEDVGATFPARDTADTRAVRKINDRVSRIVSLVDGEVVTAVNSVLIGTDADVPWPVLAPGPSRLGAAPDHVPSAWKAANGLPADTDASRSDSNGDGYLDIEDWLHSLTTRRPARFLFEDPVSR